jgi:hypothetical protein
LEKYFENLVKNGTNNDRAFDEIVGILLPNGACRSLEFSSLQEQIISSISHRLFVWHCVKQSVMKLNILLGKIKTTRHYKEFVKTGNIYLTEILKFIFSRSGSPSGLLNYDRPIPPTAFKTFGRNSFLDPLALIKNNFIKGK